MKEKRMTMSVDKALEIAKTVTTIRIRVPGTGVISHFFLKKKDFCCFLRSGLRSTKTFSIVEGFRPV